ncbi:Rib/alpha/Esp surface antigen-like repeat protein [Peptoniphilus olsenii]|uniref:Rib/alpha/Esp surface antigen-like repeat protein n=1 Tax=Peptoniphilus olsenii TaxID=411570 RepID=A0ABV2JBF1_9FIRM
MIRQKRFITLFLAILLLIGTFPVNIFAAVEKPNWDNAALEEIDANYWALPKTTKPVSISTQDPVKVTSLVYDGNYVNAKGQTVIRFAWQHRQTVKSSYWQKVIFKFDPDLFNKINWNDTKIHTKNGDVSFGSNNAANAKQIPFYGTGGLIEGSFGGKDIRIPIDIVLNSGVTVNDLNKDYLIQNRITDMAETSVLSNSFGNGHTYQSYTKATMVPFASGSFSKSLPQRYYDQPEKLDIYGTTSFAIYDDVQKKVLIYYGYQKNDTLTGKMDIVGLKQIIPTAFKNILKTDQDGNVGQIYLADYNLSRWNNNISIKFKNSDFNNDGSNERIIFAPNGFNREDSFRTVTIPKLNDYATWGATKDIVRVYTVFEYNIDEEKLEKLYEEEDFLKNFIATTSYVVGSADQWKEYNLTLNENVNIPAGGKLQVNFETSLSKKNADIIVKVGDRYFRYNNYPYAADAEGQIGNLYFDSTTSTSNKYRETLHDGMSIPQGTDIKIYTLSAYDKNTSANITLGDKTFTANAGLNSVKFEDLYESKENIGIQIPRNEFNPKVDEIFTDSTEMTGYAKRVEADVLIRQLLPASKKIDVRRPTDSVATPIDINGTQYDGYKFTSSKSDGTSTFSFVKDAPIKFRTVKQNIFPGKWVIEQVQSKIDFDYNGGIYKSGTTNIDHVEKIVPFNKEYYYNPSTGELNPNYTPNGFVGDNIKLEDNEGNKLTGEALAKRQFIFKETESNYKTNMPKLLNDYDNSMTIIGWTTVKLKNGEKTQEQQFRELKAGGDANHVRNIDDWKKTEPLIFDEKSPISEHKTVYAVWGEKGISLVPNWSENGIEKSGIVNVPISNGKPGDKVTLTSVYGQGDFVRPGYSLVGFSVNKDAKEPDKNETLLNGKVIDRFLRDGDTYTLPENYTDGMKLYAVWKPYFTVKASKEWSPEYSLDNNKNNLQLALLGRPAVGAFGGEVVDVDGQAIYYPMPGTEKDYTGSGEVIWENMPSYDGKGKRMSYLVVELVDDTMKQAFKNGSTDMTDYGIIISPMSGTPGTDTFKPPRKIQPVGFEGEGGVDAFTGATVRSHFTDTNYNNAVNPHDTSDFGYFDTYGYKTVLTNTKAEVVMPIIDQVKVKKTEPRNDITINIKDDITDIDESYTVKGKIDFAADSKSDIEYTATYKNGEWTIVFNPYGEAISLDKENSNSEKLVLKTKDPLEVDDKITASSQKGAATSPVTQMIVQLDEPSRLPTDIKQVKNISEGDKYYSVIEAKEFELELNGIPTKVMPSNTEYTLVDEAGEEVLIEGAPITVKADETGKITFKIPHNETNDGKIYKIKVKEPDRDPNTTTDSVTLVTKAPKISALNKIEGFVGEPIKPLKITTDKDANLIFDPSILHSGLSLDKTIGDYNRQWTINGTPTISGQSSFVFRSGDEFGNKSFLYSVNINILDRIKVVEDTSSAVPAGMLRVTFKLADDAKGKLEINGNPVENNSITYDVKQGLALSDAKSLGLDIPEIVADDGYTGTTWTPAIPDIFNESGEYIASIKQNIIETDGIGEIPEGYTRVKFVTGNGVEFTNAKIYDVLNGMTLPAYYYPNYNVVGNFEEPVRWTYTDGMDTLLAEPGTLIVGKAGDKAPKEIEIKADAKSTGNIKITVESENLIDKENNVLTVKEDSIWHDIKSEAENLLNVNSEESILWTLNGEPITDATRFSDDSTIKVTVVKNIVTGTNKLDAPREGYTRLEFNADSENSDAVISYGEIKDIEYFYIDALNGTEVSVLGLENITATKEGNAFKEWSPTLPTYGNVEQLPDKEFTAIYEALDSVIAFVPSDINNPANANDENIPTTDSNGNTIDRNNYVVVAFKLNPENSGTLSLGELSNESVISALVSKNTDWANVEMPKTIANASYDFWYWEDLTGSVNDGDVRIANFITSGQEISADSADLPENYHKVTITKGTGVEDDALFGKSYAVKELATLPQDKFPVLTASEGYKNPTWNVEEPWNVKMQDKDIEFTASAVSTDFDNENVDKIEIKTQPELNYKDGENLDLTSLVVTLTDKNGNKVDVPFEKFAEYGLTTNPENDTTLTADNNGKPVEVSINENVKANTDNLTVVPFSNESVIAFEPSDKVNPTDKTDENIPKIDKDGNEIKLSDYTIVGYVAKENGTLTLGDLTNKEAISLLVKNATPWADVQAPTPVGNEGYRFGSWNPNLETEGNVSEKTFEASFYKADSIIPKNVDNATNPDTSRYSLVKFVTSDENKGSVIAKEDSGSTEFWVDVREGNVIFADLSEKVNVTAKENYIFKDWTKDDLTIVKEATRINEEFVKVNSEITIKANFSDNFESIIPGTGNTKPEGYVTVIFTSGDNASLDGEKTYYIKPDGSVRLGDIIEKAPIINPNEGFKVSEPNWKKEGEIKSLDILEKITSDITLVANVAKTDAESYTPVINNLSVGKDATVSPTDFISNLNKSVKVGEDTFDKLPTGTKVEFVGDAPDTTSAGEKEVTLKITYPDGSEDEIKANLEVLDPPKKEAEIYTPVDNNQTVKAGQKPLASDSVKFTKDGEDVAIPDGAVIVWASEPDTSTTGVKDGTVTIIYSDGSRENLAVKITVEEKDPDIIPVENADTPIKDGYVRVVFEKDNKIKELKGTTIYDVRKDSDVRLGDLTKPEITPMDGYKVSESPWKLNGDKLDELKRIKDFTEKETVTITATADENQALANEPTVINQTVISGETPIAEKHVSNINELPAGTSVNYKETPPTEVGTHDVTIVINYPDGSSEEKTTKITIVTADAIVPVLPKDPSNPDSGETENPDETRYVLVELKAGENGTLEKVGDNKTLKFYVDKTKNVTFGDISSKVNPVPNEGYDFTNWTGEDGTELTENSKITDNLVATANFTNKAASNEPKVNDVRGSDKTIGGTGVAGAKIEVSLPSGEKLTTTVGTDGTWKVEVPEGTNLQAGDKIEVTQTENGKLPNKTTAEVLEKDVSKTPTILPATEGDTKVTITVPEKTDGTVEVVVNKGKDNEKTYTATKDTDGNYIVNLTEELKAGDTIDAVFTEKDKKSTEASTVTVQGKEASDAVKYNPVAQEITKKFGESVTENEIIGAVTVPDYPEDAEQKPVVTIDKGQILPDGNSPGEYNINVTVTYPDKTEDRITVKVTIVEDEVKPLADTIEPNIPTKTPVGDINNLTDTEREEIADKIKEANKDIFPENTTVSVDNKGNATIIYPDNSVDTIVATDLVKLTESPEDKTSRKPDINKLEIGDMIISGRGVAGSQIIVTLPSGDTLETIVNDDGTWAIKLPSPVEDGEKYVAVQIEEGKEPSIPDEESVIKDNKPEEPNIPDIPEIPEFPDRPMPPIPERPERDYDDYFKFPIYVEEKPVIEEKIVPQREYLIHNAYMSGYPDGTFMPNGNMTRAEAAAILTRLLNLPVADINAPNFTDTPSGWYNAYINAIVKAGYMSGYPDGSFKPNAKITRAEFAQLIKNIGNENTTVAPFEDIKGHWAEDAINKAFGNGYITGYPDGTFKPDGNITRAEATVICNKMFDRKVDIIGQLTDLSNVGSIKLFKDVDSSHWAYFEIMEATNDHRFYRRTIGLVEENWTEIR